MWWGLVAPAKTPGDIVPKLNIETDKALHDPAIADLGVLSTQGNPEDFARFISPLVRRHQESG